MGTLSIWHWLPLILVAGLMIGTALWLKRRSARKYPGELRGIGGWLAILAIVVTLWPVQALWSLWE
jgi:predicted exporter